MIKNCYVVKLESLLSEPTHTKLGEGSMTQGVSHQRMTASSEVFSFKRFIKFLLKIVFIWTTHYIQNYQKFVMNFIDCIFHMKKLLLLLMDIYIKTIVKKLYLLGD